MATAPSRSQYAGRVADLGRRRIVAHAVVPLELGLALRHAAAQHEVVDFDPGFGVEAKRAVGIAVLALERLPELDHVRLARDLQ